MPNSQILHHYGAMKLSGELYSREKAVSAVKKLVKKEELHFIRLNLFMPSRKSVTKSLSCIVNKLQRKFEADLRNDVIKRERGISIDGLTLTFQGRHYYDVTLHYMEIEKPKMFQDNCSIRVCNKTILLTEGPKVQSAISIRHYLDDSIRSEYGATLGELQRMFTVVTDSAADMANAAGSSVSRASYTPDHRWMGCLVHILNSAMKHAYEQ